jgi:hypothetical protein
MRILIEIICCDVSSGEVGWIFLVEHTGTPRQVSMPAFERCVVRGNINFHLNTLARCQPCHTPFSSVLKPLPLHDPFLRGQVEGQSHYEVLDSILQVKTETNSWNCH